MRKTATILAGILLTASVFSQSPDKMSYQAVIRDADDNLLTSQFIDMQISILQYFENGSAVYIETQTPTTNANGLVSLEIGSGTVVSGNLTTIDRANGQYFIKTETDPTFTSSQAANITATDITNLGNLSTLQGEQTTQDDAIALNTEKVGITTAQSDAIIANRADLDKISGTDTADIISDADGDTKIQVEETTDDDIIRFDMAGTEFFRMDSGRLEFVNTGNSVFIGEGAGANDDFSDNQNVAIGDSALYSNTTGYGNMANGYNALYNNTTGGGIWLLAVFLLYNNTIGYQNTTISDDALYKQCDRE